MRLIDADILPNDEFWQELTDIEKAKVLSRMIQAPTVGIDHLKALEKQTLKKPDYVRITHKRHKWLKDTNGNIDEWAYDVGFHNGPICQRCGHFFCVNCVKDYEAELNSPCNASYYECPSCGTRVSKFEHHCECGQRLDWRGDL